MANRLFRMFGMGILCIFLVSLSSSLALAQETEHKILPLRLGGSQVIQIKNPSYRMKVLTSDGSIVDARPLKENRIYVRGKKLGYCTITVWDDAKKQVMAVIDVTVTLDLTGLKQQLHELYPDQKIEVYGSEKGVVLSGTVSGPEVVEQVLRLTKNFLPKQAEEGGGGTGTGKSSVGITNLLTVGGIQQVMLEVRVAEVARTTSKDMQAALGLGGLGNDLTGAVGVADVTTPLQLVSAARGVLPGGQIGQVTGVTPNGLVQQAGSLLFNFADNTPNIFININNFTAALKFLETEGLARTLAEPRLVTQSGQEASFLAGGEFPIPVAQTSGGVNNGITIEYKEFGVALRFTPVVLSDGRISLRVAPSVSEIASTSTIPAGIAGAAFEVPSLTDRKLQTTVQLYDGQTLALAGLLQDNLRETIRKVPGLGDIPVLGALFRSTNYQQDKTDLMIAVTPHLVKPNTEGALKYPGEYMQPPNNFEFYLEGKLEGHRSAGDVSAMSRHSFTPPALQMEKSGGLEGDFGHQPVSGK
jgi:pilus assembly protein CpaC